MRSRASWVVAWLGPALALVAAAGVVSSPRVRQELASVGERLEATVRGRVENLQARMRPRMGRHMAALEEIGETIDAATTQWEASMTVTKVAGALAGEPKLRGQNVGVRLIGGILHLEGEVRGEEERNLAAEIARRASGAELVANDLRIVRPVG